MTITELIHQAVTQLSGYFFLNQNDMAQQAQSSIEQLRQHSSFDAVGATITEGLPSPVNHARLDPCIKYKKNAQQKYSHVLFNHNGKTLSLTVDEAVEKHSNNELICSGQNKQFKFGLLSEDVFGSIPTASKLQPVLVEVLNRKHNGTRKRPVTQDFLAGAEHSQDLMLIRPTANISPKSQLPESSSDADCVIYRIHNIGELGFDMKHLCFQMHQMDPHNTQVSGCTKTAWILYHCLHALRHYFDCQAEDQQRIHGDCKLVPGQRGGRDGRS